MEKNYVMVIDEGTTGTRALIFDKKLNIISSSYTEFTQYTPAPDKVEHDAMEIYDKSIQMCRQAMEKASITGEEIACIGITNQRNTFVLWDKNTGLPIHKAIVWQDGRCGDMAEKLAAEQIGKDTFSATGKKLCTYQPVLPIRWLMDRVDGIEGQVNSGDVLFGSIDCWLIWKLTEGRTHAIASSNASSLGCYDLNEKTWYQPIFDHLHVPVSIFPKVLNDADDYGFTSLFGAEIPITGAIADQQSALFSENCRMAGSAKCTNGTGTFMDINIGSTFKLPPDGLDTLIAWTLDGVTHYCYEGMIAVTGSAVQWLRDGLEMIDTSAETEEIASSVPDTNGLYFVPTLAGLNCPEYDPFARGLIAGVSRGTTKAHFVRATLEGIAFSLADIMKVVKERTGISVNNLQIDGGASKNNLLAQMISDYTQASVSRPDSVEATALGGAEMALIGAGLAKPEDLTDIMAIEKTFTPKMDAALREKNYRGWECARKRAGKWLSEWN
ncbi:MAG: glycerol kinase GlpK [Lachnospiraceae bacterium]|nr:glycerol kinase GlpK [Lachnospiraceae bacterium]